MDDAIFSDAMSFDVSPHLRWLSLPLMQGIFDFARLQDPPSHLKKIQSLKKELADVQNQKAFWLQLGPCHEDVPQDQKVPSRRLLKKEIPPKNTLQQNMVSTWALLDGMKHTLEPMLGRRLVCVLRGGGQMFKPRSNATERQGRMVLPSFQGHMIHGASFSRTARLPKIESFVRSFRFAQATVKRLESIPSFARSGYLSHEALLLPYEAAMVRTHQEKKYLGSGDFLWIGMRSAQANSAHLKLLSNIVNPVGIKVGPSMKPEDLCAMVRTLNPPNESGKIALIMRLGADNGAIAEGLVRAVVDAGLKVVWVCDAMHGNTYTSKEGLKVRTMEAMLQEVWQLSEVLSASGAHLGGLHIEASAGDFVECINQGQSTKNMHQKYQSLCDPRLNEPQARRFLKDAVRTIKRTQNTHKNKH